jgi:hypothetical protein
MKEDASKLCRVVCSVCLAAVLVTWLITTVIIAYVN